MKLNEPGFLDEKHRLLCFRFSVVHFGFLLLTTLVGYSITGVAQQRTTTGSSIVRLNAVAHEASSVTEFVLPDMKGKKHRLSHYKGHVLVVNFCSTWCIPVVRKCLHSRGLGNR